MPLIYKKNKDVHRGVFLNSAASVFFSIYFLLKSGLALKA